MPAAAEQYIDDVLNDRIVVSKYVRQAVERHVRDLEEVGASPYWFDRDTAEWVCDCFSLFRHSDGSFAGQEFVLSPWESFIVWCVFGWKQVEDNMRRFRRAYVEVARKNGKSTFLAAIAIILLLLDNEPSAQVYCAATKLDQAKIVWNDARKMVKASPELRKTIKIFRSSLAVPSTESFFVPLASDSKGLDGLNIHGAVVDELHAHPTREVWDLINSATGSRSQPLIFIITTAGFFDGICTEVRQDCIDMLRGSVKKDEWFAFVACLDPTDEVYKESNWIKANPNLPYVPSLLKVLREQASLATRSAGARNNFLVKHLCRWVSQGTPWLNVEEWDKCKASFDYESLRGRPCYAGIDMAEKIDLTCACLCFPPLASDEKWKYLWKFYLPERVIAKHTENGNLYWKEMQSAGVLTATDGFVTDHAVVKAQIIQWRDDFDLRQCAFDMHGMSQLSSELIDAGIEMVEIGQSFADLNEGAKEFEAQIVAGTIEHDGNVLMRHNVEDVCIKDTIDGYIKPVKPKRNKTNKKIDGVIAAVMALSQALRNPIETSWGWIATF